MGGALGAGEDTEHDDADDACDDDDDDHRGARDRLRANAGSADGGGASLWRVEFRLHAISGLAEGNLSNSEYTYSVCRRRRGYQEKGQASRYPSNQVMRIVQKEIGIGNSKNGNANISHFGEGGTVSKV